MLLKGQNTIRANVTELMRGAKSPARKKAISTIAKNNNISKSDAMYKQALAIAKKQARL